MEKHSLRKQVEIHAPRTRVFEALTSSEEIPRYFPLERVEADWRVGGKIELFGTIDGAEFTDHGRILELEPPSRFAYTYWSTNHGTERTEENHLDIVYELEDREGGTLLSVEQRKIASAEMLELMQGVWDHLLHELKRYLEAAP